MNKSELYKLCQDIEQNATMISISESEAEIMALDTYIVANRISKAFESIKKDISKKAFEEVEKTGEKIYCYNGYKIQAMAKPSYNYSHIPVWTSASEKLKKIQECAQLAARTGNIVATEDGEQIEPAAITYSYYPLIK